MGLSAKLDSLRDEPCTVLSTRLRLKRPDMIT
jgi:hypothetical protein